ncbi:hypothetical protein A3I84_01410 [Candidatus Nomurabacteria bacterium RIFCSPLOWO2_02_FULL_36_8]|nr:MAG: hypothetical protein A3I84_01410 [Candidatus Nomurabacteria bacterium RIFCSPLOWO2_02_FULL_36_8]
MVNVVIIQAYHKQNTKGNFLTRLNLVADKQNKKSNHTKNPPRKRVFCTRLNLVTDNLNLY